MNYILLAMVQFMYLKVAAMPIITNELLLRGRKERGLGGLPPEKFWDHAF